MNSASNVKEVEVDLSLVEAPGGDVAGPHLDFSLMRHRAMGFLTKETMR